MKAKRIIAGLLVALVFVSLTALNVFAAVQDVSINLSGSGRMYKSGSGYYFLDIYSSQAKLINAADLEGATKISVRVNATNTTSYGDQYPLGLEVDVDENNTNAGYWLSDVWLTGDGQYTLSVTLDGRFHVNPNTLGIFLSPSFDYEEDPPESNEIPNIQVLEIIVRKDVAENNPVDPGTGNTGTTPPAGTTAPAGNTDPAGTTVPAGNTDPAGTTPPAGNTDPTEIVETKETTETAETIETTDETETVTGSSTSGNKTNDGSATEENTEPQTRNNIVWIVLLVVAIAIVIGFGAFVAVRKVKQSKEAK